ncbi:pyridoxamine 5'-phosphate oxidase family protein [Mesorhizobium erdmanii]|nr:MULTISPECIES: pyridoxamine 5'-phosphate oxidase family protein [Mesorhizobium]
MLSRSQQGLSVDLRLPADFCAPTTQQDFQGNVAAGRELYQRNPIPGGQFMAKRQEQQTDLTPAEATDRIWELAKEIDICMFVTWDGEYNRARPLSARVFREENAIYFLVNDDSAKNKQLSTYPKVTLAWSDSSHYKYVTISGPAVVTNDRRRIAELWEKTDAAWWDNAEDPDIRLITVTPDEGELWDSPGLIVASAKMVFAAVTGSKPNVGDNAKVEL